ncbi:DCC1-like thiol-disulfide oxidoreductase family protein [Thalassobacillus pellis]|uniref:DCC1-like thiol-disulfide oxidoreductase family protein n=1 Tax=Thalassobacillus pellis TaxID=748008 RepID=UPI00195F29C2|nr:putative DCC family thiol-disulfide oxidoreductase YuxK [Thalassobacillus pellis]
MKPLVLYDGQCYLCRQTKSIFQWLDWLGSFEWKSLQQYEKETLVTQEERAAIKSELHIIEPDQTSRAGYHAVTYMLVRCPLTFPLGLIASIPGMGLIGKPIYRWIARNRYRIFKDKCSDGACSIHDRRH